VKITTNTIFLVGYMLITRAKGHMTKLFNTSSSSRDLSTNTVTKRRANMKCASMVLVQTENELKSKHTYVPRAVVSKKDTKAQQRRGVILDSGCGKMAKEK